MKYDVCTCEILKKEALTADTFDVTVKAPTLAPLVKPGQFGHILVPGKTLRRPISICGAQGETLRFVFQVRGEGTAALASLKAGEAMDVLAPLGSGFPLGDTGRRAAFVGGGIGVPPLLTPAAAYGKNGTAILGFRTKDAAILQKDFEDTGCAVRLATDDGTLGRHGLVTDLLKELDFDVCFACGPTPMLKAVAALCKERGKACWISLEERMACGIGACLGCAVELKNPDGATRFGHVCKDGPVFPAEEVVL